MQLLWVHIVDPAPMISARTGNVAEEGKDFVIEKAPVGLEEHMVCMQDSFGVLSEYGEKKSA